MVRLSKETMYNEHPVDEASFQSASRWFYDSAITAAGGFPGRWWGGVIMMMMMVILGELYIYSLDAWMETGE